MPPPPQSMIGTKNNTNITDAVRGSGPNENFAQAPKIVWADLLFLYLGHPSPQALASLHSAVALVQAAELH